MTHKYFITGTDTGVGKTYISVGLLKAFNNIGLRAIGLKPLATGGTVIDGKILSEDALQLMQHSNVNLNYEIVNPFSFLPPVSPHIASNDLTVDKICNSINEAMKHKSDVYIVEGIGGWYTPISKDKTMADVVIKLNIPVILVVGIRLGCLNHALLTYLAIKSSKVHISWWVANIIDPDTLATSEIIETLKNYISAPCLGIVDYKQKAEESLRLKRLSILP